MNDVAPVLVIVPDLMMRQKIVGQLTALGYSAKGVAKLERLDAALDDGPPAAVLVEIDGLDLDGPGLTARLHADKRLDGTPVVGFASHMRTELMDEVRTAGADRVIARGELVRRLDVVMGEVVGTPPPPNP